MTHYLCMLLTAACAGPAMAAEPPTPTIEDLAFLAGGWRAEYDGDRLEEFYTAPRDGTLVGVFRWSDDDGTQLTEHIVIEQHADAVRLFLRHFHPGAVAWERYDLERDPRESEALPMTGDAARHFANLIVTVNEAHEQEASHLRPSQPELRPLSPEVLRQLQHLGYIE